MVPPEADVKGAYYTTIGITLFQMVDQNVSTITAIPSLRLHSHSRLASLAMCHFPPSQISALAPLGIHTKLKVKIYVTSLKFILVIEFLNSINKVDISYLKTSRVLQIIHLKVVLQNRSVRNYFVLPRRQKSGR